jgi:nucleotide-binding universal stress UspA family protein
MPFSKLLVPVDASASSLQSLDLAAAMAKAMESRVTVLHVIPRSDAPTGAETGQPREYAAAPDYGTVSVPVGSEGRPAHGGEATSLDQQAESLISNAQSIFSEAGLEIRTDIMRFREPAEAILDLADEGWHDLIVMGSGGDDHWEMSTVGSVAMEVARRFPKSVMVVKKACGFSVISALMDSERPGSLEIAIELAGLLGSKLHLLALQDGKGSGDVLLRSSIQVAADRGLTASGGIIDAEGRLAQIQEILKEEESQLLVLRRPRVGGLGKLLHRQEWVYELLYASPASVLLAE